MKKFVTIALFIFWAVFTAVLTAGLVFYQNQQQQLVGGNNLAVPTAGQASKEANTKTQLVLDVAEIGKHKTLSDCWLIIGGKVYNVSTYLSQHPGGAGTIEPYCGQEATNAFQTKDIGRPHSSFASDLLKNYYVGNLNQAINQAAPAATGGSQAQTPAKTPAAAPSSQTAPTSASGNQTPITLNMTELAKHNSSKDCWLLISGKIYNVTSFLFAHPGGAGTITPYCGQEATRAFQTKDIGRPHSGSAVSMLASYYVGNLNQTTTQQQVQTNIQNTNAVQPAARGFEDD